MIELIICLLIICGTVIAVTHINHSCKHEWEVVESGNLLNDDNEKIGRVVFLRCKKCGEYKRKDL